MSNIFSSCVVVPSSFPHHEAPNSFTLKLCVSQHKMRKQRRMTWCAVDYIRLCLSSSSSPLNRKYSDSMDKRKGGRREEWESPLAIFVHRKSTGRDDDDDTSGQEDLLLVAAIQVPSTEERNHMMLMMGQWFARWTKTERVQEPKVNINKS